MVLRYGELCPLVACQLESQQNQKNWITDVLTFARYSLMETAIIAINVAEHERSFYIDYEELYKRFSQTFSDNTVIVTSSLLPAMNQ